jgi:hypothetical protein
VLTYYNANFLLQEIGKFCYFGFQEQTLLVSNLWAKKQGQGAGREHRKPW